MPDLHSHPAGGPLSIPALSAGYRKHPPRPTEHTAASLDRIAEAVFSSTVRQHLHLMDSWGKWEYEKAYRAEATEHGIAARTADMEVVVATCMSLSGY